MSARAPKIEGPPPETQNRPSTCDAGPVQSSFDAGQCEQADNTNRAKAEANSQTLTVGDNGYLDKASLKIVEKALVAQIAPVALSLAARAKDERSLNKAALAFRIEIYGSVRAALRRLPVAASVQSSSELHYSKVRLLRNGSLSPETKGVVEDAIVAALAPLVTSREVRGAIYLHDDEVITADLIQAIRETVWTERFAALQVGGRANG
jgi:hypothetical protein